MKNIGILLTLLIVMSCTNLFAQPDSLFSTNGDIMVGEIKSMSKSVLTFDTDYADSDFKIDWEKVKGLIATSQLVIFTKNGERFTGNLGFNNNDEGIVKLINSDFDRDLKLEEIVQIRTYEDGFRDKIYISIDAGYSFTKANNLSQFSMTGHVNYTADRWRLSSGFNSVATNQDNVVPTSRNEANVDFYRDILGNLFGFAGMEFLQSSEQMLDLRTTSKIGAGYYMVRTNELLLQGSLGLANANEKYGGDTPSIQNNFEGLGTVLFDAYDVGDFSFRAKVSAFPSLSTKGRIRVNTDLALKWDLPLDFYIKASFLHTYDSKPVVEGVEKGDYVFQTSIGWEWD